MDKLNNKSIEPTLKLFPTEADKDLAYTFMDKLIQEQCGSAHVKVRQIVSSDELSQLADARKRMYSQRKRYYRTLFDADTYLDDDDLRSYLFAFYFKDEIIGTQRVTPYPFEVANYIQEDDLNAFLGSYHQFTTVEFSRLVVDRRSPVKGVADALGRTAGTLITLGPRYTQYITYSKPYLKREAFRLDPNSILFNIPSRGKHDYELFRGSLLKDLCSYHDLAELQIPKNISTLARTTAVAQQTKYSQEIAL